MSLQFKSRFRCTLLEVHRYYGIYKCRKGHIFKVGRGTYAVSCNTCLHKMIHKVPASIPPTAIDLTAEEIRPPASPNMDFDILDLPVYYPPQNFDTLFSDSVFDQ